MTWEPDRDALRGRVAVVAGATRGAGRGIAAALGEAGATVICTGRSSRTGALRSDYDRAETIEETAELVTALGGTGIAAPVDHLDPARWRGWPSRSATTTGTSTCWSTTSGAPSSSRAARRVEHPDLGARPRRPACASCGSAIDTHLITSHHLLPLLIDRPGGLLVEVTDGTTDYNATHYRISVYYDLAKVAVNRLAFSQGHELAAARRDRGRDHARVAALGDDARRLRRRRGQLARRARSAGRHGPTAPPGFAQSESPRYVGRAVVALAADPERARWNQQSVSSGAARARVRLHRSRRLPTGQLEPPRLAGPARAQAGGCAEWNPEASTASPGTIPNASRSSPANDA